jgi:IMP and pyridine-specific 5'-nucleotidase
MGDVELLINDHIEHETLTKPGISKLKHLVPAVGVFHTPLFLEEAFLYQDERRRISSRRFVAPSFNDIRLTLNTAQLMSLARMGPLKLITFDGDVTLYDDGDSLSHDNPVIKRILALLAKGIKVAIVTAAGYTEARKYYERLFGLLEAVRDSEIADPVLAVLGGESNYLFVFDRAAEHLLRSIPRSNWLLPEMKTWTDGGIKDLLDVAEGALRECVETLGLEADILRKERAVGIIPRIGPGVRKLTREQLEETVLVTQQTIEMAGPTVPFCAFNGGNDIFVDIGDKSWGVMVCQSYLGGISGDCTLHVGDQFLSAGANDFKARLACTTAWIASPLETVQLLDELEWHLHHHDNLHYYQPE